MVDVGRALETAAAKLRLFDETGAVAADMESAAIVQWARSRGLPAAIVRAVSDGCDRGVPPEVAAIVDDDGRTRPVRALRVMLGRPSALLAILALRHGTSAALDAVAAALVRVAHSLQAPPRRPAIPG
jgi:adenosylhomocysteine nucleosidase